jgi:hypothetical protein
VPDEFIDVLPSAEDIEKRVKARFNIKNEKGGYNE